MGPPPPPYPPPGIVGLPPPGMMGPPPTSGLIGPPPPTSMMGPPPPMPRSNPPRSSDPMAYLDANPDPELYQHPQEPKPPVPSYSKAVRLELHKRMQNQDQLP